VGERGESNDARIIAVSSMISEILCDPRLFGLIQNSKLFNNLKCKSELDNSLQIYVGLILVIM
jgi:hypothetical protein